MNRIAPSARIEEQIENLLIEGVSDPDRLAEVGRLGAQLILQLRAAPLIFQQCADATQSTTGPIHSVVTSESSRYALWRSRYCEEPQCPLPRADAKHGDS